MKKGKVCALIGAQYGSEGKGVVAAHIAYDYKWHVRTGGPNAGHSFVHEGKLYKMQSLPCGWFNKEAQMVIGRGAVVNLDLLFKEIRMVAAVMPCVVERIHIDAGASVLSAAHHEEEGGHTGEIGQRIGSTGEGVGACRLGRIGRDADRFHTVGSLIESGEELPDVGIDGVDWKDWVKEDTPRILRNALRAGENVMLEGTQGSGLSLIHGPWPFVTSHDTNAATLAADAGVPPHWVDEVIMVARTHPIRVGGNSGPLEDEMSWEQISQKMGKPTSERTTVTKKLRRVGKWDEDLVRKAVTLNAPTSIALTFMDYWSPEDENCTEYDKLSSKSQQFITYIEGTFGTPVNFIGTGFSDTDGWTCIEKG